MIKYRGDRLWVKLQFAVVSILWGLVVAWISVRVTAHLDPPVQGIFRIIVFLLGFTALDIGVRKEGEKAIRIV